MMQFWDQEATVVEAMLPGRKGRVDFQGSWWRARCTHPITIQSGALVQVVVGIT